MSGFFSGAASMLGFGGTTTLGTNSASLPSSTLPPRSSANSVSVVPRLNASRSTLSRSNVSRSNSLHNDDSHVESLPPAAPSMRNSASLPASVSSPLVGGYRKRNKKSKKAKKSKKVKRTRSSRSRRNRD